MTLQSLYLVLRSRFVLIAFVALATVAVSYYFSSKQPERYVATASLLLNFASENPFDESTVAPQLAASYMATQVDIIASRSVALQVLAELEPTITPAQRQGRAAGLLSNLEVEPSRDSRLIFVRYGAATPEEAARYANAFARGYAASMENLATEPAKRNAARFDSQIELMRARLATAQSALTNYQQEKGIVAIDERLDTETTRLQDLADALIVAQAGARDVRSRQLGANHPEYVRATRSEAALVKLVAEQKERLLELKQQREELGVLARELDVEQQTYDTALQSYYAEQMRSSFGHAGVDVLDPAVPPGSPDTPKIALNVVGALLLGTLLGMLLAVAAEFASRRLRTSESVEELLDTRLLNSV